jgi:DNA-binding response OmpR family regulator
MFDASTQRLTRGGSTQRLTAREAAILKMLALKKNDVVERKELLNAVWGDDSIYNSRSLDVFISKLRKYLSDDPTIEIGNVHGVGYKLVAQTVSGGARTKAPASRKGRN